MPAPWEVFLEPGWPEPSGIPWRLAMEVDPRRRVVRLGPRVPDAADLDVQSGAIARSFFEVGQVDLTAAGAWVTTDEAQALLDTVAAGFHCEVLWTGDPSVTWSDEAWDAGRILYLRMAALLE